MSVFSAELSFDGFEYTVDPNGPQTPGVIWHVGLETVCLPLLDPFPQFNTVPDDGSYFIGVGYQDGNNFPSFTPGAFQYVTMRLGDAQVQPTEWQTPFITPGFGGADPALLVAGGTLTITKDFGGNTITFSGPLGSETVALSDIDALPGGPYGYNNATPLRPRGLAHRDFKPDPSFSHPGFNENNQVEWFNLIGRQDGIAYDTVALSTGDSGNWWPIVPLAFDSSSGATNQNLAPWWSFVQQPTREQVKFAISIGAGTFPIYQLFLTQKRRRPVMAANPIDMTVMRAQNILFTAWESMPTALSLRRSHDDGHTWTDTIIEETTAANSPSIQTLAGSVFACYHDGTRIVQQSTRDLGASWSEPMPVSITGTNPRLVISPEGMFFYFYCASGNLLLQRSFDLGVTLADATPIVVALVVSPQDFGAVLAADRTLVVSYTALGQVFSRASQDWGASWKDA